MQAFIGMLEVDRPDNQEPHPVQEWNKLAVLRLSDQVLEKR
jgi:hypothetical protein